MQNIQFTQLELDAHKAVLALLATLEPDEPFSTEHRKDAVLLCATTRDADVLAQHLGLLKEFCFTGDFGPLVLRCAQRGYACDPFTAMRFQVEELRLFFKDPLAAADRLAQSANTFAYDLLRVPDAFGFAAVRFNNKYMLDRLSDEARHALCCLMAEVGCNVSAFPQDRDTGHLTIRRNSSVSHMFSLTFEQLRVYFQFCNLSSTSLMQCLLPAHFMKEFRHQLRDDPQLCAEFLKFHYEQSRASFFEYVYDPLAALVDMQKVPLSPQICEALVRRGDNSRLPTVLEKSVFDVAYLLNDGSIPNLTQRYLRAGPKENLLAGCLRAFPRQFAELQLHLPPTKQPREHLWKLKPRLPPHFCCADYGFSRALLWLAVQQGFAVETEWVLK